MFGLTRWNPVDDMAFQREFDRLFNQIWGGAPTRAAAPAASFHVRTLEDGWQVSIPIPGIDPKQVAIDVSGQTLTVHAEPDRAEGPYTRFDQ
ncbi:MAG: hypothetical protein FJW23_16890, partial [Acidimicrobiia bacterium]|nr:hypothetical protein [Acidimicrobiia bacterium]